MDISEISSDFEALPITDNFGSFSDVKSIKSSDISVGSSIDLFFFLGLPDFQALGVTLSFNGHVRGDWHAHALSK